MKNSFAIAGLFALCLLSVSSDKCHAQSQSQLPATPPHSQRKPQGFFDYALGKVNPSGNDYGASLQLTRDSVVDHSVDDLYFWSNVVTLLLLCGTASIVFLQWRSAEQRDVIAASLIAELWNGRVSDRVELERRTSQFNELVEAHNAEVEKALFLKTQSTDQAREAAGNLTRSVQKLTGKGTNPGGKVAATEVSSASARTPISSEVPGANSHEEHLLLQRQLEATRNSEQNLKQRLNQTTLLLDQERRRNGALKGA
jgi:hypothetical protein